MAMLKTRKPQPGFYAGGPAPRATGKPAFRATRISSNKAGSGAPMSGVVRKPNFKAPMKKGPGYKAGIGRGPAHILPVKRPMNKKK